MIGGLGNTIDNENEHIPKSREWFKARKHFLSFMYIKHSKLRVFNKIYKEEVYDISQQCKTVPCISP